MADIDEQRPPFILSHVPDTGEEPSTTYTQTWREKVEERMEKLEISVSFLTKDLGELRALVEERAALDDFEDFEDETAAACR